MNTLLAVSIVEIEETIDRLMLIQKYVINDPDKLAIVRAIKCCFIAIEFLEKKKAGGD